MDGGCRDDLDGGHVGDVAGGRGGGALLLLPAGEAFVFCSVTVRGVVVGGLVGGIVST